mmetsp:Transcript_58573/g.139450  ORF Transcript_58573/g.139450 Transcript_58573/m.139450 type:complete len:218 (-) Transcript_58573:38-691(-)
MAALVCTLQGVACVGFARKAAEWPKAAQPAASWQNLTASGVRTGRVGTGFGICVGTGSFGCSGICSRLLRGWGALCEISSPSHTHWSSAATLGHVLQSAEGHVLAPLGQSGQGGVNFHLQTCSLSWLGHKAAIACLALTNVNPRWARHPLAPAGTAPAVSSLRTARSHVLLGVIRHILAPISPGHCPQRRRQKQGDRKGVHSARETKPERYALSQNA